MKRIAELALVIVTMSLASSCKKNGDAVLTAESEKIDSTVQSTALSGEFPAVYINWNAPHVPSTEGNAADELPNPKSITGSYKLIAEPSGPDSLNLYIDGSGTGPTFTKTFIGKYNVDKYQEPEIQQAYWRYKVWYLADQYLVNSSGNLVSRGEVLRYALADHTRLTFTFYLAQVTNSKLADYGQYLPFVADRSNDLKKVAQFYFTRRSAAVIK